MKKVLIVLALLITTFTASVQAGAEEQFTSSPSQGMEWNLAYSLSWFGSDWVDSTFDISTMNNGFTLSGFWYFGDPSAQVGLETGMFYWSYNSPLVFGQGITASAYTVPIVATAGYVWKGLDSAGKFDVYFNLGLGAAVSTVTVNRIGGLIVPATSTTETNFMLVFTPGFRYSWFYLEPKLGSLKSSFLFELNIGIHF